VPNVKHHYLNVIVRGKEEISSTFGGFYSIPLAMFVQAVEIEFLSDIS